MKFKKLDKENKIYFIDINDIYNDLLNGCHYIDPVELLENKEDVDKVK